MPVNSTHLDYNASAQRVTCFARRARAKSARLLPAVNHALTLLMNLNSQSDARTVAGASFAARPTFGFPPFASSLHPQYLIFGHFGSSWVTLGHLPTSSRLGADTSDPSSASPVLNSLSRKTQSVGPPRRGDRPDTKIGRVVSPRRPTDPSSFRRPPCRDDGSAQVDRSPVAPKHQRRRIPGARPKAGDKTAKTRQKATRKTPTLEKR